MLLPENIHPENTVYYNGYIILRVLMKNKTTELLELYHEVKKLKNMTYPIFTFSLDWLFLANIVELKNGKIELCS